MGATCQTEIWIGMDLCSPKMPRRGQEKHKGLRACARNPLICSAAELVLARVHVFGPGFHEWAALF